MTEQSFPLRYEATVKDGASAAMERIASTAERLDQSLLKVQRDQRAASEATKRAADEAANAAARSATGMERAAASAAALGPRYRAVAGETGAATERVRGLGVAAGVMGQALESAGVAGGGAAAALGGKLSGLAAAGGPAAVVIGALGVAVWGLSTAFKAAAEESDRAIATARQWSETSSASAAIGKAAENLRRQREAAAAGTTTDVLAAREEIRSIQARETALINLEANRLAAGDEEGAAEAAKQRPTLVSQRQRLERDLTTLLEEEARKRTEVTRRENDERTRSFEQFSTAAADAIRKVEDETQRVKRGSLEAGPLDQRLGEIRAAQAEKARAEIARQVAQIDAQERARVDELRSAGAATGAIDAERARFSGLRDTAGTGVHALVDQETRALEERERARFEALDRIRVEAAAASWEKQAAATRAATAAIGRDELDAQLLILEEQRRQAVAAAEKRNEDVAAVNEAFDAEVERARAGAAQRAADEAAAAAADHAQRVQDLSAAVATAASDLEFEVAQSTRDSTEQQVADVERRYAALIEQARAYGVETVRLEEELAEKVKAIRAEAGVGATSGDATAPRPLASGGGPSPWSQGGGAGAAIREIAARGDPQLLVYRGITSSVDELAQGFGRAATGAMKLKDAMKETARSIVRNLADMAAQAMVYNAVSGLIGGLGTATGLMQSPPGLKMAEGGVVSTPRAALMGEAGPEAVVPLSRGRSIPVEMRGSAKGSGEVHVHHNHTWHVQALDARSVAQVLVESRDTLAAITADSLRGNARIRGAVKEAARS